MDLYTTAQLARYKEWQEKDLDAAVSSQLRLGTISTCTNHSIHCLWRNAPDKFWAPLHARTAPTNHHINRDHIVKVVEPSKAASSNLSRGGSLSLLHTLSGCSVARLPKTASEVQERRSSYMQSCNGNQAQVRSRSTMSPCSQTSSSRLRSSHSHL
mmetsp:Transcript_15812/g.25736  ORF Transcript_15812/g.25736 Transcript_15812/m.25736 type:complete len:156 (+) Transcript_15812:28-495(+)